MKQRFTVRNEEDRDKTRKGTLKSPAPDEI